MFSHVRVQNLQLSMSILEYDQGFNVAFNVVMLCRTEVLFPGFVPFCD